MLPRRSPFDHPGRFSTPSSGPRCETQRFFSTFPLQAVAFAVIHRRPVTEIDELIARAESRLAASPTT
jgi:hypothetical protein